MKCPYRDFKECLVENCPSCNYEKIEHKTIDGTYPNWMSVSEAIKKGYAYNITYNTYKFVSCKLIENSVQPIPKNEIINNTRQVTNVSMRKSIF